MLNIKYHITVPLFVVISCIIIYKEYARDKNEYNCPKEQIDDEIKKIVLSKQKKISHKVIDACKDGMIRGCISGGITSGIPGAINAGLLYGVTNALFTFIKEKK